MHSYDVYWPDQEEIAVDALPFGGIREGIGGDDFGFYAGILARGASQ